MPGFADDHALILYVYLSNYEDGTDDSVLTVSPCPFLPRAFAYNCNSTTSPPTASKYLRTSRFVFSGGVPGEDTTYFAIFLRILDLQAKTLHIALKDCDGNR